MRGSLVILVIVLGHSIQGCPSNTATLIAQEQEQYLSSPNHPGYYANRYSCSWKIVANDSYSDVVIQIRVINSSLEPATGCWRDVVEVIDGPRSFQRPLETWCGSRFPKSVITSSGPSVLVTFSTDFGKNDYAGFFLAYWIANKPLFNVYNSDLSAVNYVLIGASVTVITTLVGTVVTITLAQAIRNYRQKHNKDW